MDWNVAGKPRTTTSTQQHQIGYVVTGTYALGCLPDGRVKAWLANAVFLSMFRIMARCFSNVVHYHGIEHRPQQDGICVANHTSPIDCVVLAQDCCYSFVSARLRSMLCLHATGQSVACFVFFLGRMWAPSSVQGFRDVHLSCLICFSSIFSSFLKWTHCDLRSCLLIVFRWFEVVQCDDFVVLKSVRLTHEQSIL